MPSYEDWEKFLPRMNALAAKIKAQGAWIYYDPVMHPKRAAKVDLTDDELRDWLVQRMNYPENVQLLQPEVICWLVRELVKKEAMG